MPRIKYIEAAGNEHDIEVPVGVSVMAGAVLNMIPGIDAECGGACACGTCHVLVDPAWQLKLPPKQEMEAAMLEFVAEPGEGSRLSCQVQVTSDLEGLTVRIPPRQR
jgi:2Fe-2S ferredoxin